MGRLLRYSTLLAAFAFSSSCTTHEIVEPSPLERKVEIDENTPLVIGEDMMAPFHAYMAALDFKSKKDYGRADDLFSISVQLMKERLKPEELRRNRLYSMALGELALNLIDYAEHEMKKGRAVIMDQTLDNYIAESEKIWENKIVLYVKGRVTEALKDYASALVLYQKARKRNLPLKKRESEINKELDTRISYLQSRLFI